MTVSQHANAKRWLSATSGASEPGKYKTDRAPFQKEMMDEFNDPQINECTIMAARQMCKTIVIENIMGYNIDIEPSPMIYIAPTDLKMKKLSKIRFAPFFEDNKYVRDKMQELKSRESGSEIMFKRFSGGYVVFGGANVAGSLTSFTARIVMFDEVDEYPVSAGQLGDPIDIGRACASTYLNRFYIYVSTPTNEGTSRIETQWNKSDKRLYYVPCPICGHMQILIFSPHSQFRDLTTGFLKFDKANLSWVYYECANCRKAIEEKTKPKMLLKGDWRKQLPQVLHHAGFHINQLYSPWVTWMELAKIFLETKNIHDSIRVFINHRLGEIFRTRENYQFSFEKLLNRRERYGGSGDYANEGPVLIPKGIIFLTVGVDTQDDRLEAVVKGWGLNEESWFIERRIIRGSPSKIETWQMLDAYLSTPFVHENGFIGRFGKLGGILAVGIDTGGHHTKEAYEYCNKPERRKLRIFGIKGVDGFGKPFIKQSFSKKYQVALFLAGVDSVKQTIYERLNIAPLMDDKENPPKELPTPGRMHLNFRCDKEYFDGLTAEKIQIVQIKGQGVQKWIKPSGAANEPLDCEVYALAAYALLNPPVEKMKEALEHMMQRYFDQKKSQSSNDANIESSNQPITKSSNQIQRPKRGWMNIK